MNSDLYEAIEEEISESCNAIHDGWYTNYTQTSNIYNVQIFLFITTIK